MLFFGRYVTPFIALAVLAIGLISSCYSGEARSFRYVGFFQESIQTYFLAKTIFCATVLFLLGQLVAAAVELNRSLKQRPDWD
jgi:hypothetical protein